MRLRASLLCVVLVLAAAGCVTVEPEHPRGVYSFATIGDSRSGTPIVQPQVYLDCIALINGVRPRPSFVVNVGDLILGYTEGDTELTLREWEEFDRVTAGIELPVYLVAGNHDAWDEESHATFIERYGPTYYSFDYMGDHFVVLCSEEPGEEATIAGAQLQWLAEDLEKSKSSIHTFAFLHRPLWGKHRGMAESGWDENVHPLLAKYGVDIVFAGHDHQFVNYGVRDGVQYYVTGGGGASTSGLGGFHHFMVTTVGPTKIQSVVVTAEGEILPHDVVTAEMDEAFGLMSKELTLPGVTLPDDSNEIVLTNTVHNPFGETIEIVYEWDVTGSSWQIEPSLGKLIINAGGEAEMEVTVRFDRDRLMPVPALNVTVSRGGKKLTDVTTRLQPLLRSQGVAARVAQSPVADGVVAEGEYGSAKPNGGFVDYRGLGYPQYDTEFLLAYDDTAIYIAVVAEEPEPDAITLEPRKRDGNVWEDDDVELFIDATFDRSTYHQFIVNLGAVQLDSIGGPGHGQWGDTKWNAEWVAVVKIGQDEYVVEFAIPFEALGVPAPKPGDKWGLNVCRVRQAVSKAYPDPMMAAWSIPYANFHVPTHFGNVTFQ